MRKLAALAATVMLASCADGNGGGALGAMQPPAPAQLPSLRAALNAYSGGRISHIVIIIQENRTPDNLFQGLAGADIAKSGVDSEGRTVALIPIDLAPDYDVSHNHHSFVTEYNGGRMDGFDRAKFTCRSTCDAQDTAYTYVPSSQSQPYLQMAQTYTFADRMFQSNAGPSFPAHQYLLSGTSAIGEGSPFNASENPVYASTHDNCDGDPASGVTIMNLETGVERWTHPCFEHRTLFDVLDERGVSYTYYDTTKNGLWNAPSAIAHIRNGRDWAHVVHNTQIFSDISAGRLAAVSWVIPSMKASDHALHTDGSGPSWVGSIVNAIGTSKYWKDTAIFVTWDDWGGWYDHVAPRQFNHYELGMRVPLIVISPYAKKGYVSHVQHEFGSILRFAEWQLGLRSLGNTDERADDLSDCFDFGQAVSAFTPFATKYPASYFQGLPRSEEPPDND